MRVVYQGGVGASRLTPSTVAAAWLVPGQEYLVLSVDVGESEIALRLDHGRGGNGLFDARMFRVSSSRIPPNWEVSLDGGGLSLAPAQWLRNGFWEDYFDSNPLAEEQYEAQRSVIIRDEHWRDVDRPDP